MRGISPLLALLVFFPTLSHGDPFYILTTPNVLRVESDETVLVEAHESNFNSLDVDIRLQHYPRKSNVICQTKATLSLANQYQATVTIKIPKEQIPKETRLNQYVALEAVSSKFTLERVILISYQTGHIFIQTDKPIYTPAQSVLYRLLTVNNELKPSKRTTVVEFLNPQNVVVQRSEVFAKDATGITGSTFKIPEIVNIGVWKIIASYKEANYENYTTEFEVKEYVLPSFEVTLESEQHFFYVDDKKLDISITARFTYGEPVEGRAIILFGILKNDERMIIPSSLQSVTIKEGYGMASLTSDALKTRFPNIHEYVGYSIYITASVITHTGSDMVEAEKLGIKIVNSPYTISFTKTSKYFKPGMPFDLMVYVMNPDGSPANGIPVVTNNGQSKAITQADGNARMTINTAGDPQNVAVHVQTNDPNIPGHRQASANMVAEPYKTQDGSNNYLHIGIQPSELSPGNNLVVHLNLRNDNVEIQNQIKYFTYMLLNKGQIVRVGRQLRQKGQVVVTMLVPITPNLIPSFRILVYYYVMKGGRVEMVADSIWIDVKDTCMGNLIVSAADARDDKKIYKPGKQFKLKLKGDPGARVGLVAVDKAVFILNKKNKLTQSKIWSVVEKKDIGCTPGSGSDVLGVFSDAGLAFVSNTIKTAVRSELKCKQPMKRSRRSPRLMEMKATKLHQYIVEPQRKCCRDGMKLNPMGFSCNKRARRIVLGQACKDAFLDCCNHIQKFMAVLRSTQMTLARSDDDDSYSPYEDIVFRSDFPESWLWLLNTLPRNTDRDGLATKEINGYLKDSITTWEIQAVSVSSDKGICVAQPYELTVLKEFFIDLRLPYSVVRNEQVEVRAILYNYEEEEIKVRVEFPYNENLCSNAKPTERYRQTVTVQGKSSTAVPFVIIPLTIGEVVIEVKASVYEKLATDGVRKSLRVVPEGKKIERLVISEILDPKGKQQVIEVDTSIKDAIVPQTEPLTFISVQGDLLSETIENSIDGAKLKHLIRIPTGCGEQNMASMTPGVIVTNYLDKTLQWERVGMERREISLKNIQQGYIQELAYRKEDGSYAAFKHRAPSTWLTAYVVKVFAMANSLIAIEPNVLCGAVKWLILQKQKPDGRFQEDAPVVHGEMTGGFIGSESHASLTAFVLIAMLEAKPVCSRYIESYENSVKKAGDYLDDQIGALKRTYSVAITTYALSLLNKNKLDILMKFASPDQSHWADVGKVNSLYTIEATGYSLLAFVQLREFEPAGKIVKWLSQRSEYGGGYSSTQATMVGLQALADYMTAIPPIKDVDLEVLLSIPGRSRPIPWHFDSTNMYIARSEKINADQKFNVTATGKGQGTLKVLTSYHTLLSDKAKECKKFNLDITVEEVPQAIRPKDTFNSIKLIICARYLDQADSSMVIVDISMLTGFSPDLQDLELISKGVDKFISKFELDKALSVRGSLIIYLNSVSHVEDTCFGFKVHQSFKVGLVQPASVKIYEYYDTENSCTKFYHVNESSIMLTKICQGEVCRCAEGSCISVKNLSDKPISPDQREEKSCAPGIDYVYKITFINKDKKDNYLYYRMKILTVIKQGSDEVEEGQERLLITHSNCGDKFDVALNENYLIMGEGSDLDKKLSYVIGGETWMEWWPNDVACQQRPNSRLCQDLAMFSENLMIHGCGT
ncbi:complement C3-like [Heptranchias perlo]|uniref:complement C3-like n=1 Tax=Heptranchias perlo TaxID=212740 RepID=UPI003559D0CD